MKTFFTRAGIFAVVNAILIGLLALVSNQVIDTCIIAATLCSIFLGIPYEYLASIKQDRKPVWSEYWGASIFGSIVAAFIVYAFVLIL